METSQCLRKPMSSSHLERTRLMPGGRVAIIQTRWHMDDLTGRVIDDMIKNEGRISTKS